MALRDHAGSRNPDFDLVALYSAIDAQRTARALSWSAVAAAVSERRTRLRPIAVAAVRALEDARAGEGDGILQMLIWLRRTPESFMPGVVDPRSPEFLEPTLARGEILRWNSRALYDALDAQRRERKLTWAATAAEIGSTTPSMLTHMSRGGRVGFPQVMRLVRWLDQPAASFTYVARW